ncbi:hypothetical protein [Tengunoibacter tsumagoiensis]|uniref:Uncharacterized protein n=1 Tax=Tengunoibacter tsumagoiensis TaxID=2014871 RepID=A0A402A680_9CHLR|nr:hypothetical protein [Tengunoibacter tsumagoiensis]GCE14644.1 hypothetical protein KTT_45030 [Tengunoibacter tsumagoiensis]
MNTYPEHIRALARQLGARLKTDATFKEQVEKNPIDALGAAGLQKEVVADFLRETGLGDVAGYLGSGFCSLTVY